ncbi:cell cycle checkpoint control protein RAD9A [Wyeomyia smithii]|uniref:cell cycle checkpoint control protein RAD9A n=1 Tax=Wyeomyia smithii TaxID=174621 RepID=UPI0024680360|nr:cell cycle checkpoint control protein RAD9A [Wyeomyia smithii]
MNCIIAGPNVKILARTVNFFSKIGRELELEALPTGLSLRVVNPTSTACAVANFSMQYFIKFRQGANDSFEENNCRVSIKFVLRIFKSLATILTCKMWLDVQRMKIIFQFKCKSEVTKTHTISLLEHDNTRSLRLPKEFSNKIVGDYKIISNILVHFHSSVHEITFDMSPEKTVVTNYIENVSKDRTTMRSTCVIESSFFKRFDLSEPTKLTFCYKEFKAMAHYARANRIMVEINFNHPGTPLVIRMQKANVLHIHLIMGTMIPKLEKQNRSVQRANRNLAGTWGNDKHAVPVEERASQRIDSCSTPMDCDLSELDEMSQTISHLRNDDPSQRIEPVPSIEAEAQSHVKRHSWIPKVNLSKKSFSERISFHGQTSSSSEKLRPVNARNLNTSEPESYDIVFAGNSDDPNSEMQSQFQLEQQPAEKRFNPGPSGSEAMFRDTQMSNAPDSPEIISIPETVLESPEAIAERKRKQAKVRYIFQKCFEDTIDPRAAALAAPILAESSDPEDS